MSYNPEYHKQWYFENKHKRDEKYRKRSREYAARWRETNREKAMIGAARSRAKKSGLDFNIDISDVSIPEKCPILLIPLFFTVGSQTDNTPCLDRIDNTQGYVKGNVSVISHKANRAKGDLSADELQRLADYANSRKN